MSQEMKVLLVQVIRSLSLLLTGGFQNRLLDRAAAGSVCTSVFWLKLVQVMSHDPDLLPLPSHGCLMPVLHGLSWVLSGGELAPWLTRQDTSCRTGPSTDLGATPMLLCVPPPHCTADSGPQHVTSRC